MRAITLHEKYTEEIIGTVLLKGNTNFDEITDAWDKYQVENNSNLESEPDIYEFAEINKNLCEVLELDFYSAGTVENTGGDSNKTSAKKHKSVKPEAHLFLANG